MFSSAAALSTFVRVPFLMRFCQDFQKALSYTTKNFKADNSRVTVSHILFGPHSGGSEDTGIKLVDYVTASVRQIAARSSLRDRLRIQRWGLRAKLTWPVA